MRFCESWSVLSAIWKTRRADDGPPARSRRPLDHSTAARKRVPCVPHALPDVAVQTAGRVLRLGVDSAKPSIAGALAYSDDSRSITGVRLHVVKPYRRQGVGSTLLNYAVAEARHLGRTRVFADTEMRKEPDADAFLSARGFHLGRVTSVRGPLVP